MKNHISRSTEITTPRFLPLGAVIDPDFDLHAFDLEFLTDCDGTIWQDAQPKEAH